MRLKSLFTALTLTVLLTTSVGGREVKLLAYNIFMMPQPLATLFHNKARLRELPGAIKNYDIIGISEATPRDTQKFLPERLKLSHPYSVMSTHHRRGIHTHGGLVLLSRFPILESFQMIFTTTGGGLEQRTSKGAIFARLEIAPGSTWEVVLTHLQAGPKQGNHDIRIKQISELKSWMNRYHQQGRPLFLLGDLNIVAQNPAEYDPLMNTLGNFTDLYQDFREHDEDEGRRTGFTFDAQKNPLCWGGLRARLDYILLWDEFKKIKLLQAGIPTFPMQNPVGKAKFLSDHFGVDLRVQTDSTFLHHEFPLP